jgi:tetratricopeptide (TPR) repeat protein
MPVLAYILLVVSAPAQATIPQFSGKWCDPVTSNVTGKITINCIGIDPRALDVLSTELDRTNAQADERVRQANEWAEKYKQLEKRLEDAGETSELSRQAQDFLRKGQFAQAGAVLDRIIAQEQKTLDRLAADHYNRAMVYQLQFDHASAIPHLEKAHRFSPDSWRYGADYAIALAQENRFDEEKAVYLDFYGEGKKTTTKMKSEDVPYGALMAASGARFFVQRRQFEPAEKLFKLALEGLKGLIVTDPSRFFDAWISIHDDLGSLYSTLEKYDEALDQYTQALATENLAAENDPDAVRPYQGRTWWRIGDLHQRQGNLKEAMSAYQKAAKLFEDAAGGDPQRYRMEQAEIVLGMVQVARANNQPDVAEAGIPPVLEIFRELAEKNPAVYQPRLAMALNTLGDIYLDQNKLPQAESSYQETLELWRNLAKGAPKIYQWHVAETLNHLAVVYGQTPDMAKGEAVSREELTLWRGLYESDPSEYRFPFVQNLNNLAQFALAQEHWSEAEKYSREAMEAARQLAKDKPSTFPGELVKALNLQGAALVYTKQPADAEARYVEILQICQQQTKLQPDPYQIAVGSAMRRLASFYEEQGKLDQALQYAQQASDVFRKLRPTSEKVSPYFSDSLVAQVQILQKRKAPCSQIVPLASEAEKESNSDAEKQYAADALRGCPSR